MIPLARLGATIEVTPLDDIQFRLNKNSQEFICDREPFYFRVSEWLQDGQIFYGLCGPVISGHQRYQNKICNLVVRSDGADWRKTSRCLANFKVGSSKLIRDHQFDFRHPDGTRIFEFPRMASIGEIKVVEQEKGSGANNSK
jgi:hypothetical protein